MTFGIKSTSISSPILYITAKVFVVKLVEVNYLFDCTVSDLSLPSSYYFTSRKSKQNSYSSQKKMRFAQLNKSPNYYTDMRVVYFGLTFPCHF